MAGIIEFGDELLRTRDLDPVYVAVHGAGLRDRTLWQLCLAYWCFYHLGAAARIAEAKTEQKFWGLMVEAARNEGRNADGSRPWPRGAERRHFRGHTSRLGVDSLGGRYKSAQHALTGMIGGPPGAGYRTTYAAVARTVQSHYGFGQWIAFKIADMSERVLGYDTDFTDCALGIYKDPRQGAAVAWREWQGDFSSSEPWNAPISNADLEATVAYYVAHWRRKKAPPDNRRAINVQEVETIFCKYKSHLKGHYPVGKDTAELRHGLTGWGDLAQELARHLPKEGK